MYGFTYVYTSKKWVKASVWDNDEMYSLITELWEFKDNLEKMRSYLPGYWVDTMPKHTNGLTYVNGYWWDRGALENDEFVRATVNQGLVGYFNYGYCTPTERLYHVDATGTSTPVDPTVFNVDGNAEVPLKVKFESAPLSATTVKIDLEVKEDLNTIFEYHYEDELELNNVPVVLDIDSERGLCTINDINAVEGIVGFEFPSTTGGTHSYQVFGTINGGDATCTLSAKGRWL